MLAKFLKNNKLELVSYKCHKVVQAVPMTKGGYDGYKSVEPGDDFAEEGYLVIYKDGYESWSPALAFNEGYSEVIESNYLSRLHTEGKELEGKVSKLEDFTKTDQFRTLSIKKRQLLFDQLDCMRYYLKVLVQRLELE